MATPKPPNTKSPFTAARVLSTGLLVVFCGTLRAENPLTLIPADVAMVVSFRNLNDGAAKLDDFIRSFDKHHEGVDLDEVQRGFNLPDGVVDTSAPTFLILTRPPLIESSFVLAFTPRDVGAFSRRVDGQDDKVIRCEEAEGRYYLMMRGDIAFVALKSTTIRLMRHVRPGKSLAATLDDEQKKLFASNDVVIHIPLEEWRDRIQPILFLTTNMIRLSLTAANSDPKMIDGAIAVIDWFTKGFKSMVEQMQAVTLALHFDGETFHLTHHHVFDRGRSVSDYLAKVRRSNLELWPKLPDRPFLMLGMTDWRCPVDMSINVRLNRYILGNKAVAGRLSAKQRRSFLDAVVASYGRMRGTDFMLTCPKGKVLPFQAYGTYVMDDAEGGIRDLVTLDEYAGEVLSGVMGGIHRGKSRERQRSGRRFFETELDLDQLSPRIHKQTAVLYGKNVRLQQAVADERHVVFCLAEPPVGVHELFEDRPGRRLIGDNPLVKRIVSRLPRDANAIFILDLGRCLGMVVGLRDGVTGLGLQTSAFDDLTQMTYTEPPGPYLGWAGVVGPTSFTGQWAMDAGDLVRTVGQIKAFTDGTP